MATNLTESVRVVRLFKIDGYSATTAMGDEDFKKARWIIDGYGWEIRLYPAKIKIPMYQVPWVAVGLLLLSDARTNVVRANLACRLVDPRGSLPSSELKSEAGDFSRRKGISPPIFVYLLPSRDVATSGYLKDDTLSVQCTVTVLKDIPVPTVPVSKVLPMPPSNLVQHLAELLRTGTGADVTFVVSGESFAAHKNILAARSPVFSAEFFGNMRETISGLVEVQGVEPAAFKAMLRFIYTDTVPELDQESEALVTAWAKHLLAAADRYGMDRLKLICEIKLSTGITVDTAATTLALAEQHNCSHLKAKCVEFILSTPAILDAVIATEGYRHLEATCPAALTSIVISMRGGRN